MFTNIADFFLEGVAGALAIFYSLPVVGGNYGLAIIMLTLVIMVLLMPLTLKATRSTIKMAQMQPKLKALQKKYKDDRMTMNAEVMALYKEHNISPVGGCLPIIAQMPVFLILFNVLRGITRRVEDLPFYGISDQAWNSAGGAYSGKTFAPNYLDPSTDLYQDLSQDVSMDFGPLDLGEQAWDVLQSDFVGALPYILLILFVVGSSYYQQRQVQARRSDNIAINPQQQMLMRVLPLLSGIWGFIFPAGLVLYWATSNGFRVGQQAYITRSIYSKQEAIAPEVALDDDDLADEAEEVEDSTEGLSERELQWANRRKAKANKAKAKRKPSGTGSSRTTPKGTQSQKSKR